MTRIQRIGTDRSEEEWEKPHHVPSFFPSPDPRASAGSASSACHSCSERLMPSAFLFPGQGSQYVRMATPLCDALPAARRLFDEAPAVLGYDPPAVCPN